MPKPNPPYPPAFKTEAVRLVHRGDKSIANGRPRIFGEKRGRVRTRVPKQQRLRP